MDLAILHWIQNTMGCPFLDWLMPIMSALGEHGLLWVVIAVVMLFMKKYRKWGVFLLVTVFCCWVVGDQIVKPIIARPRPFVVDPTIQLIVEAPDGFSMPSGHTLAAFCAATVLLFSPMRKWGKALVAVLAVLVAFSRLYLCVHNPTDVLAGALFGIAFGLLGAWLCRRWSLDLGLMWRRRPSRKSPGEPRRLLTTWGQGIVDDLAFPGRERTFVPLAEHPRPQFARKGVRVLNGTWECAFVEREDAANVWRTCEPPEEFPQKILVPFSPEAPLSGVGRQLKPDELLWYRLVFDSGELPRGKRYILHFGAVDYACACYVNGSKAALHVGGYLPFEFDMTEALVEGENEIEVCVYDPSERGPQPRGKQRLGSGGIWYTAQSGIWKTVWVEGVPENYIVNAEVKADLPGESLTIVPRVREVGERFTAVVRDPDGRVVGRQSILVSLDRISTPEIRMHVPRPRAWSPEDPCLYRIEMRYGRDEVESYCAFRTVEVREDDEGVERFYLNGEPYFLKGVLDQGYWPDGLMTPPSDEARVFDLQSAKDSGFNMVRMHVKVEDERWYYHCDRLGVLVWQDLVSGGDVPNEWVVARRPSLLRWAWGHYDDATFEHCKKLGSGDEVYRKEWRDDALATVRLLKSHPCIVTWSLFNEGWGQFASIAALSLVRGADDSRPIDAASGWFDQGCGDWFSVHNYYRRLEVYRDRKGRDGEGGGLAEVGARDLQVKRAFVLSEFGAVSLFVPGHSLYGRACGHDDLGDSATWRARVEDLLTRAERLEADGASGFVFTQLSDVEGETDGILTYDRRVNKLGAGWDEPLAVEDAAEASAGGAASGAAGDASSEAAAGPEAEKPAEDDAEADEDAGAEAESEEAEPEVSGAAESSEDDVAAGAVAADEDSAGAEERSENEDGETEETGEDVEADEVAEEAGQADEAGDAEPAGEAAEAAEAEGGEGPSETEEADAGQGAEPAASEGEPAGESWEASVPLAEPVVLDDSAFEPKTPEPDESATEADDDEKPDDAGGDENGEGACA